MACFASLFQVVLSDLTVDLEVRAVVRIPPDTEDSEPTTEEIVLHRQGGKIVVFCAFLTSARANACVPPPLPLFTIHNLARNARGGTFVGSLDAASDRPMDLEQLSRV